MASRARPRRVAAAVVVGLAGCVAPPADPLPPAAPPPPPLTTVRLPQRPAPTPPPTTTASAEPAPAAPALSALRAATVRIRSVSCEGVGVGSGFFTDPRTVVTAAHVVDGAGQIDVETWDGRRLPVERAEVSWSADVAFLRLRATGPVLPLAGADPEPGTPVTAYGYPEGEPFAGSPGQVLAVRPADGRVAVHTDAVVVPGNSGGPLVAADGSVVGVVYAREVATGWAVAVPVSVLRALRAGGDLTPVTPC